MQNAVVAKITTPGPFIKRSWHPETPQHTEYSAQISWRATLNSKVHGLSTPIEMGKQTRIVIVLSRVNLGCSSLSCIYVASAWNWSYCASNIWKESLPYLRSYCEHSLRVTHETFHIFFVCSEHYLKTAFFVRNRFKLIDPIGCGRNIRGCRGDECWQS